MKWNVLCFTDKVNSVRRPSLSGPVEVLGNLSTQPDLTSVNPVLHAWVPLPRQFRTALCTMTTPGSETGMKRQQQIRSAVSWTGVSVGAQRLFVDRPRCSTGIQVTGVTISTAMHTATPLRPHIFRPVVGGRDRS